MSLDTHHWRRVEGRPRSSVLRQCYRCRCLNMDHAAGEPCPGWLGSWRMGMPLLPENIKIDPAPRTLTDETGREWSAIWVRIAKAGDFDG